MCSRMPKIFVQMCSSWLICYCLCLCEQGFSLTKVIKSDWRSRLRDTMVTDLMTIQLHSPEIADFDEMMDAF